MKKNVLLIIYIIAELFWKIVAKFSGELILYGMKCIVSSQTITTDNPVWCYRPIWPIMCLSLLDFYYYVKKHDHQVCFSDQQSILLLYALS